MSLIYTYKYIGQESCTNYLKGNANCKSNESHHVYNAIDIDNKLVIQASTHIKLIVVGTTSRRWFGYRGEIRICDIRIYKKITKHMLLYFLNFIIECTNKAWKSPCHIVIESKELLDSFESFLIVPSKYSFLECKSGETTICNYKYKKYIDKLKLSMHCTILLLSKYDCNSSFSIFPHELIDNITKLQIYLQ